MHDEDTKEVYFKYGKLLGISSSKKDYMFTFAANPEPIEFIFEKNSQDLYKYGNILKGRLLDCIRYQEEDNDKLMVEINKKVTKKKFIMQVAGACIPLVVSQPLAYHLFAKTLGWAIDFSGFASCVVAIINALVVSAITENVEPKPSRYDRFRMKYVGDRYRELAKFLNQLNYALRPNENVKVERKRFTLSDRQVLQYDYDEELEKERNNQPMR